MLIGWQKTAKWIVICCNNFFREHCQRLILLHYFHQKIFQEEIVTQFLWSTTRETRSLYITFVIFFSFFEYHDLFKALQLTQFHYKDSTSFKNNIMFICSFRPLCCCYCDVFLTLGFIIRFFIENPPSHIHIGVFIFILAYSESTQTSKKELFAKVVTCWQPSVTNFSKGYVVDV